MIPKRFIGENIIHLPTVKTHIFTTTTGAMKNAFGGLLNEHRHWTHPVIHETLVDLLMIQKKIHRGVFAVMDGTFAGDGPGPRCMVPHVKNVILASADQVAIDAVAAKLMGFDPMSIKFIRLAHDLGLGCGDPRDIEIVGDADAARENWHFDGPFKKMTFASRMQHKIYWGPLKMPIEWSLKTVLAPWAYMASVIYHDSFWYPFIGQDADAAGARQRWGRLFRNWDTVTPDARGFSDRRRPGPELKRTGLRALGTSLGILGDLPQGGAGVRQPPPEGRQGRRRREVGTRLLHAEKLHVEDERRIGRNGLARALGSVRQPGRNDEPSLAADPHAFDALIPAWNDVALSQGERERFVAVARRIELGALVIGIGRVVEPARVVDADLPPLYGAAAGARRQLRHLKVGDRRRLGELLLHGGIRSLAGAGREGQRRDERASDE